MAKKAISTVSEELTPATIIIDDATSSVVHKHLSDINDTITEEDIRNINTNMWVNENIEELAKTQSLERKNMEELPDNI